MKGEILDFKNVKKQITQQTRDKLGLVQVSQPKGVAFYREKPVAIDIQEPVKQSFVWSKKFYILERGIPSQDGYYSLLQYHLAPAYDINVYTTMYPTQQYMKDFYWFNDVWANNLEYIRVFNETIDGGNTGSFNDNNLYHNSNTMYSIYLPSISKSQSSIKLSCAAKDISLSVWVREYFSTSETSNVQCLYSSKNHGLSESWLDLDVPIGKYGSDIIVCTYNRDPNQRYVARPRQSGVPEYIGESTDHYFKIYTDLTKYNINVAASKTDSIGSLSWESDISSTCDPITGNVVNTLTFNKDATDDWDQVAIYRRQTIGDITIKKHLPNNYLYNTVLLSTSDKSVFSPGLSFNMNSTTESVRGSFIAYGNKVLNSGFCEYSGNSLSNWTKYNSSASSCTSYPYKKDYIMDGASLRFIVSTTTANKTYYLQNNAYISVDSDDWLSYWYKLDSGNPIGVMRILYYKSNYSPCFISSSNYVGLDKSEWTQNKYQFDSDSTSDPVYLPPDCAYIKLRFYPTLNHSAKAHYLLDNIHVGRMSTDYIYNDSTANYIAVNLYNRFEHPHNTFTKFYAYYNGTSSGYSESTVQPTYYGKNYCVSSTWGDWAKFNNGILIASTAKNYLANSNFISGLRKWSTSRGFNYSWIRESSSSYDVAPLYNTAFARFIGYNKRATLTQSTSGTNLAGNNSWVFGVWAKSFTDKQSMVLHLEDARNHISTARFSLSNSFNNYQVSTTFSSGGNTVYARVIADTGKSYWTIDINATQLEKSSYISAYNYHDTSSGSNRNNGSLIYTNNLYYNQDYGTLRMWYTPTIDSDQGLNYRYLFSGVNSPSQVGIYYDKTNQYFALKYKEVSSAVSTVHAIFNAGDNLHIVAVWDTAYGSLYVNGDQGNIIENLLTNAPDDLYIGSSTVKSYSADGIIANLRIDHTKWLPANIRNDYYAESVLYSDGDSLMVYKDNQVGRKDASYSEAKLIYIDDSGLLSNTSYDYVFRVVDKNGNLSNPSTVQSIVTPRKPFEKINNNKLINSSFEILDSDGWVKYWDKYGFLNAVSTASHKYINTKSVYLGSFCGVRSGRMDGTNTAEARHLTFHAFGTARSDLQAGVYYLDGKGVIVANTLSYVSDFVSEIVLGVDEQIWTRYSTTMPAILSSASYNASMYSYVVISNANASYGTYIDAVQYETGDKTDYQETMYFDEANLPDSVVKGNALAYDCIIGRHLYAGELTVSSDEQDANRILLGHETADESYTIISHDEMKWHAPNLDSGSGWNYTKHIESGEAIFGTNVTFSQRYYNWGGSSNPSPTVIITPKRILTYSTASIASQQLEMSVTEVTASGFTTSAKLYADRVFYNASIDYMNIHIGREDAPYNYSSAQSEWMCLLYGTPLSISVRENWASTVLSQGSKYRSGSLNYALWTQTYNDIDVYFYGTSAVNRNFVSTTWNLLGHHHYDYVGPMYQDFIMNIDTTAFARCTSIAFKITNTYYVPSRWVPVITMPEDIFTAPPMVMFNSYGLTYSTSNITILKSNAQIGSFNWVSLDGGIIG